MNKNSVSIDGKEYDVYSLNTLIIGTGAAGYNAAHSLIEFEVEDIAILTEGIKRGTSRNTGSDKQTYYKLTLSGGEGDSVLDMADTLFKGGAMHGDIALVEAALSAKNFYKLANIGVPFPHNRFGEYIGYKTDHDPRMRATSAGPLTSKFMTEKLEALVNRKNIPVFDEYLVVEILKDENAEKAVGLIALNMNKLHEENYGITLFNCTNIIYAVGGPADIYKTSVYPDSQTGATGIAMLAGAKGINLTESQYGIASIQFKWNLSGTYQQIIPRYVSTDINGNDPQEFLDEYFDSPSKMLTAIFLKGYEWPFDPRKIINNGSSLIDILVFNEITEKNRRVFLDFANNPACASDENGHFIFSLLEKVPYEYLNNSGALLSRPINRLEKMNPLAIELYKNNGIDIKTELLEIAVCAQHNNGGLLGNIWWESNLQHFFPVGEVSGTFGVYRPGGSALNSTQTGSFRAAQYISNNYLDTPLETTQFQKISLSSVNKLYQFTTTLLQENDGYNSERLIELKNEVQNNMTINGAHIRSLEATKIGMKYCLDKLKFLIGELRINSFILLPEVFKIKNILVTQYAYLYAISEYILQNGQSRGSYLIANEKGELAHKLLPKKFTYVLADSSSFTNVCNISIHEDDTNLLICQAIWEKVREIPKEDYWFENVWASYRNGNIHK